MKNKTLVNNLLVVLALILFPIFSSPDLNKGFSLFTIQAFLRNFVSYILLAIFFLVHYYVLIPSFYLKKKWWIYGLIIAFCCFLVTFSPRIIVSINDHIPPEIIEFRNKKSQLNNFFSLKYTMIFQFFMIWILSLLLQLDSKVIDLKNKQLTAEVSYLKAQINPHFLFNTLNNIYSLTLTNSKKAPFAVLKLSDMMRYIVTESDTEKVSLEKELQYIRDFIDLQKLRMGKQVEIEFTFNGNPDYKVIAPIILINYIENAFKYGVSTESQSKIIINITIENFILNLYVKNDIVVNKKDLQFTTEEGNKNTLKRLNILYDKKHNLDIELSKDIYITKLQLDLS